MQKLRWSTVCTVRTASRTLAKKNHKLKWMKKNKNWMKEIQSVWRCSANFTWIVSIVRAAVVATAAIALRVLFCFIYFAARCNVSVCVLVACATFGYICTSFWFSFYCAFRSTCIRHLWIWEISTWSVAQRTTTSSRRRSSMLFRDSDAISLRKTHTHTQNSMRVPSTVFVCFWVFNLPVRRSYRFLFDL